MSSDPALQSKQSKENLTFRFSHKTTTGSKYKRVQYNINSFLIFFKVFFFLIHNNWIIQQITIIRVM